MSSPLRFRLQSLQDDFSASVGRRFQHFFCPVLWRDEEVELCRAHIINKSFFEARRTWTVQRADVDHFFGTMFESEFSTLPHAGEWGPENTLADPRLRRKLKPKLFLNGREVEYYDMREARLSADVTPLVLDDDGKTLGLKLSQEEAKNLGESPTCIVEIDRDLRMPALVSLLKAAHLTLFHLMGYRYALSLSGHFLGRSVLGTFFLNNRNQHRTVILREADTYFSPFTSLLRPVLGGMAGLAGTLADQQVTICWSKSGYAWGKIVYIRTGVDHLHAVLTPLVAAQDSLASFFQFISSPEENLITSQARWNKAIGRLEARAERQSQRWPKM